MQLVKLITPKRIKTLRRYLATVLVLSVLSQNAVLAQDNSPYSRYGIGDITPASHVLSRAMGGISATYTDVTSVNFSNPASYAYFQTGRELKSKKIISGRAILDVGVDFESRSLLQSSPAKKFVAGNALFSYIQVGVPLKSNWGLSFGLRPVSRISYNMYRLERLHDPVTGQPIDSAVTTFKGDGGSYVASVGTGFDIFHRLKGKITPMEEKLSFGINSGYYFGKKDFSTRREFINDSVDYLASNYETKASYGSLYLNAGLIYRLPVDTVKKISLTLGAFGNLGHKISATQDLIRETFAINTNTGEPERVDSVYDLKNVKGKISLPASYTFGISLQRPVLITKEKKSPGWMVGIDFSTTKWSQYRYYGQSDSVRNNWEIRVGGLLSPVPARNYFSNVTYRAGFYFGPDYIKVGNKMSRFGASFGMDLPVAFSRQAPNQFSIIHLTLDYSKRGTTSNILRENMFRFSLGFSLSDLWFGKRKYE